MDAKLIPLVMVVVAIQLALQIAALIQLGRTPSERVSLGGKKWLWIVIILLGEIIGAVLWFALGRTAAPAADNSRTVGSSQDAAVDALYGPAKE